MKIIIKILLIILVLTSTTRGIFGQPRAKIVLAPIAPYMVLNPPFVNDSSVFSGIGTVANKTFVYMYVWNWGDNSPIIGANWIFNSKPPGSNATIIPFQYNGQYYAKFRADTTGVFIIRVTMQTATTSKDTTVNIVSANFVGTGGFAGIPPQWPNCMACHQGQQPWQGIFDRWKFSGHANFFRFNIDSGDASYNTDCITCHTTGYNHFLTVNNHGFENVARALGWSWSAYSPPKPGNWDTLRIRFPSLVAFASIGCESCHGPGSSHASTGDTTRIQISLTAGTCAQCHADSPPEPEKYPQWLQSGHAISKFIYTSSWAQTPSSPDFGTNNLNNCIRCHDARGYVNFTYNRGTNTTGWTLAQTENITCGACHDPHGNSNWKDLRNRPTNSDTLANGYHYAGGNGKVCMDCHKSRKNNVSYVLTRVTSPYWGPHDGPQADILNGQNAATFNGIPYISGSHRNISDACVQCHMAPTADSGTASYGKVGEHTFKMADTTNNYDNVHGCLSCHPGVTKFDDFIAPADYDGDGNIDPWQSEIAGCLENLARALPHTGVDSVSWQLIAADSNNVTLRKAYWNYLLIKNDHSLGIHNPFFVVQVLLASIANSPIGINPNSNQIPNKFELAQNYPNPFNPTTTIKFSIAKTTNVSIKIYDLTGRLVNTLVNQRMNPGKYNVSWTSLNSNGQYVASGVYFYRIEAGDFTSVKKMVLVK